MEHMGGGRTHHTLTESCSLVPSLFTWVQSETPVNHFGELSLIQTAVPNTPESVVHVLALNVSEKSVAWRPNFWIT